MQKNIKIVVSLVLAALVVGLGVVVALNIATAPPSGGPIQVVAAENFWGSLISQLGGSHVHVFSIVSDPNADPHEYGSGTAAAVAVANARLVIVNGAGYDVWAEHLIAASNAPGQVVLNVANLLGLQAGVNPHFWYSPTYVNATVQQMVSDLISIDGANAPYYQQQYAAMKASLGDLYSRVAAIKQHFAGTNVSSTESIFVYLANATGLNLVSPVAFMNAVSEGTDPPAQSVSVFENQLKSGNVSVLVYNLQTVTPLTQQMKQIAVQYNVTVVGVTETIQPPDVTFQVWTSAELLNLQNALNAKALGH